MKIKPMRELHTIKVDKYERDEESGEMKCVGRMTNNEVFHQLREHLLNVGLLPDEYFTQNAGYGEGKKEIPNYKTVECFVNWGGKEGIYLDINLVYYNEQTNQSERIPFALGKTLDMSGDAFLRMNRIAAECSMMMNGKGRVVRFYENEKSFAMEPDDENQKCLFNEVIRNAENQRDTQNEKTISVFLRKIISANEKE